ncbi:retrotransposon protein, putative, ty1-copia subclass [Tanacetum coccineum]|uniref:Retrotransposon protein, putative, ty1-copia subclass n=1 Tax=Tanacetum coccineum TaxID=301880 RepID=A0ABQ4YM60_9ASTR
MDWMQNLRFTLRYENKEYVLDEKIPTIDDDSTQEEIEAHQKHYDDANKVSCIMASSMKMKGYFDRLESLNIVFDTELSIDIILSGLPADYNQFVLSYQMNRKETSIMELHSLLQIAEQGIRKIDVSSTSTAPVLTAESEIAPIRDPNEAVCFYCNTKGHWKHSCPKYLKDLIDEKVEKGSHLGMFMIELHNTTASDSWVLDTGCGTHICTVLQGLKKSRRLKHGELNLVKGNKKITHVTRIGKYELMLKSGVRIDLNNCCYSSEMTRNIILFHALFKDGYKFSFDNENEDILVYSNGCFMFKASPCKGIYETVEYISDNVNVILNVGSSNELDKSKLGVFLEREMISKEDSKSKIDLEEIQEFADEEPIVNTDTQQEVVTHVKPDDISLPIHRTSGRVSKPSQFYYGFHIKEDKISDSTLSKLDEPAKYKEAMASPKASK